MAGCSVSLMWLDDALEECWVAPAVTSAFRRDASDLEREASPARPVRSTKQHVAARSAAPASAESVAAASVARVALNAMLAKAIEHETELGRLDAVAGDGDHGAGMTRGLRAAVAAADETQGGIGTVLQAAGEAFSDAAGGTSGILWGLILSSIGHELGDSDPVTSPRLSTALHETVAAMQRISEARVGDKSMLDALVPFADAFTAGVNSGMSLRDAWREGAKVADGSAAATAALTPRVGRARPLAERSLGTPDPGATSLALLAVSVGVVLEGGAGTGPTNPTVAPR